ncbi:hypothetical protein R3W88_014973 [Solanum pinnatisectum]|uniref:Uncharacterized protein n=1 Tax=Solanum pinnatisectum TaxID=50273 RepID=A0AAV9KT56_9SOLN|nr:hypothetical protein R3W88_014973 [Solanum pinnatisectum]
MKESVQLLESSFRRVDTYMASNKKLKLICKCLRDLKQKQNNQTIVIDDSDFASLISLINGVEDVSITMLESTLSFISHPKMRSKTSGWSLASKILKPMRVSCEGIDISEVGKLHMELLILRLKRLETFESSMQELEEGLGVIFRLLLKKLSFSSQYSQISAINFVL